MAEQDRQLASSMALPSTSIGELESLRERGAQRIDPVRFRLVESMLQRAAAHEGPVRRMLDDKAWALLQALGDKVVRSEEAPAGDAFDQHSQSRPVHGGLAGLVAHIAQHKPGGAGMSAIAPAPSKKDRQGNSVVSDSPIDPKTLQFFRRTWSRLSSAQRLAQSHSSLPDNAGPLNSQHLVHRSLKEIRELSPEYFDLFISHVDALLWLEKANEQAAREVGLSPRARSSKKAAGTKRG